MDGNADVKPTTKRPITTGAYQRVVVWGITHNVQGLHSKVVVEHSKEMEHFPWLNYRIQDYFLYSTFEPLARQLISH